MLDQVVTLKSGALPADMEYMADHTVGASLGREAIRSGVVASAGGLALVGLFMLAYYRRSSINALVSIAVNLLMLVALIALIPVTMTLAGIAGLILTIGMGVDSNVLIFERIREELTRARSARLAVAADRSCLGHDCRHARHIAHRGRASVSVRHQFDPRICDHVDARPGGQHLHGGLRIQNAVRGLAAAAANRTSEPGVFAGARVPGRNPDQVQSLGKACPDRLDPGHRGWRGGDDDAGTSPRDRFAGGTSAVIEFASPGVTEDDVRQAVAPLPGDESVQRYGSAGDRRFQVRLPLSGELSGDESGDDALESGLARLTTALTKGALPAFEIVERDLVSAAIGADLQRRGVYATLASIVAISAYIAVRFRLSFAVGAIAATVHDVLVTLGCLAIAGFDLSLNVTAALLTIIGYSVNDTIVISIRTRKHKDDRGEPLASVVDVSVNQTLSRTVITAGTTLLSVLALYLFGGRGPSRLCVHDACRHCQWHVFHRVHCLVDRDAPVPAEEEQDIVR